MALAVRSSHSRGGRCGRGDAAVSLEYGDFQTPDSLARRVMERFKRGGFVPASIFEPTCGVGNLLVVALETYPQALGVGLEINAAYASRAAARLMGRAEVRQADFFGVDIKEFVSNLNAPTLIVGNPPWVTNSAIGAVGGSNLPKKTNAEGLSGSDARTGKSNFDISEAILLRLLEGVQGTQNALCVIVKTSVARKLLRHAAQRQWRIQSVAMYAIDAKKEFNAAVDASVLILSGTYGPADYQCQVYGSLEAKHPGKTITVSNGLLIADAAAYAQSKRFIGKTHLTWRSGIKHDCASVMELRIQDEGSFENGLGERPLLEADYLYPMLKSSDLGNRRLAARLMMVVPQTFIGEPTEPLRWTAPLTWAYLNAHREALGRRGSSIYRNNPEFSIFGVGPYSFAPWKVAISGLYKSLEFALIAPSSHKPVVMDDTCYFLACDTEAKARVLHTLLRTPEATDALNALIFWDEKRPITKERLQLLDLNAIARATKTRALPELLARHPAIRAALEAEFDALCQSELEDVPLFALS